MGMKIHTEEYKKMMSERKRQWWIRAKTDGTQYKKTIAKISKNNAKTQLGKKGKLATNWKGGGYVQKRDGYVYGYAPTHPNAKFSGKGGGGYVLEHRLVMEKILGRYLLPDEDVNHINGKKGDNRPENLVVVRHYAHYQEMKCPKCEFKFRTR